MQGKKTFTPQLFVLANLLELVLVLGTLINFLNMKRVNTRGMDLANKHVLMAALSYNLKKYLKYVTRSAQSQVNCAPQPARARHGAVLLFFAFSSLVLGQNATLLFLSALHLKNLITGSDRLKTGRILWFQP